MIKLTRIDDRLVHGQVAFTWTPALGVDCLVVANDKVAKDEFQKMALGLAKPSGVKLLIKSVPDTIAWLNDPKSQPHKVLIIINSVKDALALSSGVAEIQSINFGGIRGREGAVPISKAVSVTAEDRTIIKELLKKGIELEVRQVPTDNKQMIENLL